MNSGGASVQMRQEAYAVASELFTVVAANSQHLPPRVQQEWTRIQLAWLQLELDRFKQGHLEPPSQDAQHRCSSPTLRTTDELRLLRRLEPLYQQQHEIKAQLIELRRRMDSLDQTPRSVKSPVGIWGGRDISLFDDLRSLSGRGDTGAPSCDPFIDALTPWPCGLTQEGGHPMPQETAAYPRVEGSGVLGHAKPNAVDSDRPFKGNKEQGKAPSLDARDWEGSRNPHQSRDSGKCYLQSDRHAEYGRDCKEAAAHFSVTNHGSTGERTDFSALECNLSSYSQEEKVSDGGKKQNSDPWGMKSPQHVSQYESLHEAGGALSPSYVPSSAFATARDPGCSGVKEKLEEAARRLIPCSIPSSTQNGVIPNAASGWPTQSLRLLAQNAFAAPSLSSRVAPSSQMPADEPPATDTPATERESSVPCATSRGTRRNQGAVPGYYRHGIHYNPSPLPADDGISLFVECRMVAIADLPSGTTLNEVLAQVRGGKIVRASMVPVPYRRGVTASITALVSFAKWQAAVRFVKTSQKHRISVHGAWVTVSLIEKRSYPLQPMTLAALSSGATRCVTVITESVEEADGLQQTVRGWFHDPDQQILDANTKGRGHALCFGFRNLEDSIRAFKILTRQFGLRRLHGRVQYTQDPCDQEPGISDGCIELLIEL
jgi:hypothetical protein